jgi:hypothetical protein
MKKILWTFAFVLYSGQALGDIDDHPTVKSFINLEHHFDYVNLMEICAGFYRGFPQLDDVAPELKKLTSRIRAENYKKMGRLERKDTDERSNSVLRAVTKLFNDKDGNGIPKDLDAISRFYDACGLRYVIR